MDLRRTLRIPIDLPARFRTRTRIVDGRVRNLSQGGCMFLAAAALGQEREVELEIDLPDAAGPLSISGEIRWHGGRGAAGIRITRIASSARRRLANLILRTHHARS